MHFGYRGGWSVTEGSITDILQAVERLGFSDWFTSKRYCKSVGFLLWIKVGLVYRYLRAQNRFAWVQSETSLNEELVSRRPSAADWITIYADSILYPMQSDTYYGKNLNSKCSLVFKTVRSLVKVYDFEVTKAIFCQ